MIRPCQDNVIIVLEPEPTETASGIQIVKQHTRAHASRIGRVLASGPGYYKTARRLLGDRVYSEPTEVFVPNETKPGDRVIVDADPGNDYRLDLQIPRHNVGHDFVELVGERAEFRVVRESEIYAVIESKEQPIAAE